MTSRKKAILGSLLGTAVGDSIGLPCEGLSRKRIAKYYKGKFEHRFIFGKGMISDDTEHTLMVAKALHAHSDDPDAFQKAFAKSLRWWFAGIPAGIGLATAKASIKLWLGFPPRKSGVFSAGNGPAMRSAIIGVYFSDDDDKRKRFVSLSTRVTHTDPIADEAAQIISKAAALAAENVDTSEILKTLRELATSTIQIKMFNLLEACLQENADLQTFTNRIGFPEKISGFAPISVSVAIYAWLRYRYNYREIIANIIEAGGDTDTVAAIAGGIAGVESIDNIPKDWIDNIVDYPVTPKFLKSTAQALEKPKEYKFPSNKSILIPVRNLIFLITVLTHGFRRLLPPY